MQKKITESTALTPLGYPGQQHLFRVPSGDYRNRCAALIQTSPSEIALAWSDAPDQTWSEPVVVVDDTRDGAFDAVMTEGGNLHLVYSEQTTNYLVTRRLTIGELGWSAGDKVTIYNGAQCYDPSLALASDDSLWVGYSLYVSPARSIYAKSSTDGGATWGTGSDDPGDQLAGAATFAFSSVIAQGSSVHALYHDQDTTLWFRTRELTAGEWSAAVVIATGSGFDTNFDMARSGDGRLGVAFNRDKLYYREYDGSNWGGITVQVDHPVSCPQVRFVDNIPAVVYLDHLGGETRVARFTGRRTSEFDDPKILDPRSAPFDHVLAYHASSESYEDLTAAAGDSGTADVYHSISNCLVKETGDVIYLGQGARFRIARVILSTLAVGGDLMVSYWDGSQWRAFTPHNGTPDLQTNPSDLVLWSEHAEVPANWQRRMVDNRSAYWVKVEALSDFTTGPVGDLVCAASETERLLFRR